MQAHDVIGDRFELQAVAGSGAMGMVWRAIDHHTGETVALKVLHTSDPKLADRFAREAEILTQIRHPSVVRYVASGLTPQGQRWLAMEWLQGEDLGARLASHRGLTPTESVDLARQVAEGLGAAHELGVVHRDVKPSNLFLIDTGERLQVKVVDFGVARVSDAEARMTATGSTLGTPAYMAPEQAAGQGQLTAAADVFALGSVLFECLTGRPAYPGDSVMEILGKVLFGQPPRLREVRDDLPAALDAVLARMMARDAAERYRNGSELAAALAALSTVQGERPQSSVYAAVSLTRAEQRLLSVVVMGGGIDAATDATLDEIDDRAARVEVERLGQLFGLQLSTLGDGSIVAVLKAIGIPTEQIERAARFALRVRELLPEARIGLATGWGVADDQATLNEVVARAMTALRASTVYGVRVDRATVTLLESRFEVASSSGSVVLERERLASGALRAVLGKPTECVGRVQEIALLEATFGQCIEEESPRAVLLTGALGMGKSRLAHEFTLRLERDGHEAQVLRASGDPLSAGGSHALVAEALRRFLRLTDDKELAGGLGVLRERLTACGAGSLDGLEVFVADLMGMRGRELDEDARLRAARVDPALLVARLQEAFTRLLGALCKRGPVVMIVDDLHLGDLPSVRAIDAALRDLKDAPLLVVGIGRPEVAERFPGLWRDRDITRLELGRLPRKGCERLVQQVLGKTVADAVLAEVLERADGNPYCLEELIRHVASGGDPAQFPDSLLGMVHARLDALHVADRLVLRAASVFGQTFWHSGAVALSGGVDRTVEVHDCLERLLRAEFVRRQPESSLRDEVEYVFASAMVRDSAYATLTDADRKLGHRLAMGWLKDRGERRGIVLARHAEAGGDQQQAAEGWLQAAEEAFEANDMAAVLGHVERGLHCLQAFQDPAAAAWRNELRGQLRLLETEVYEWKGDWSASEGAGNEALQLLAGGSAAWFQVAGSLAVSSARMGPSDAFAAIVARSCTAQPLDEAASARKVIALCRGVLSAMWVGRYDLGTGQLAAAREEGQRLAGRHLLATARLHHATAYKRLFLGETGRAVEPFEAAARAWDEAGDRRSRTGVRTNLGFVLGLLGQYPRAESVLRDQLEAAGRLGLDFLRTVVEHNLGTVLAYGGRLEEGMALKEAAVRRLGQSGHPRLDGNLHASLAEVLLLAGRCSEAADEASQAVALLQPFPPTCAYALGVQAQALLQLGRVDEALAASADGMALLDALGGIEEGEALLRLTRAEALLAGGQPVAAAKAAGAAERRLQARAATIAEVADREVFLSQVAVHIRTAALARQLST